MGQFILSTIFHPQPQSFYLHWRQLPWAKAAVTYTRASPSVSSAWGMAWVTEVSWRPSAGKSRCTDSSLTLYSPCLNLFPFQSLLVPPNSPHPMP